MKTIYGVLAKLESHPDPADLLISEGINIHSGKSGFNICRTCPVAQFIRIKTGEIWAVGPTKTWTEGSNLIPLPLNVQNLVSLIDRSPE